MKACSSQSRTRLPRLGRAWLTALLLGGLTGGCADGCSETAQDETEARDEVTGLTPTEANEVLAHVGDRKITLGEYAAALARMDRYERMRYRPPERQKQLLEEMIEAELLAQEAERRGLDEKPEVALRLLQALRDEMLAQLEREQPKPEDLSREEVRKYYEKHRSEFKEPERRRVLTIVVGNEQLADKVAQEAQGASGQEWGELAQKYSLERAGLEDDDALELAGDLGFVSAPGQERGENPDIPGKVRQAVFELGELGDVAEQPVLADSRYYIVRLGGISPARERSLAEADALVRAELLREKFLEAEAELEAELREEYGVAIDEQAIRALSAQLTQDSSNSGRSEPPKAEPAAKPPTTTKPKTVERAAEEPQAAQPEPEPEP